MLQMNKIRKKKQMTISKLNINAINANTLSEKQQTSFVDVTKKNSEKIAGLNEDYGITQRNHGKNDLIKSQQITPPIYVPGVVAPKIRKNTAIVKVPVYVPKTPPIKIDLPPPAAKYKKSAKPRAKTLPKSPVNIQNEQIIGTAKGDINLLKATYGLLAVSFKVGNITTIVSGLVPADEIDKVLTKGANPMNALSASVLSVSFRADGSPAASIHNLSKHGTSSGLSVKIPSPPGTMIAFNRRAGIAIEDENKAKSTAIGGTASANLRVLIEFPPASNLLKAGVESLSTEVAAAATLAGFPEIGVAIKIADGFFQLCGDAKVYVGASFSLAKVTALNNGVIELQGPGGTTLTGTPSEFANSINGLLGNPMPMLKITKPQATR